MKRKLTERQVWLRGAREWAKAIKHKGHYWVRNAKGLCTWLDWLWAMDVVDDIIYRSMVAKIRSARNGKMFYWPTDTAAGRNARVRFCMKQADLLEKSKKKARRMP